MDGIALHGGNHLGGEVPAFCQLHTNIAHGHTKHLDFILGGIGLFFLVKRSDLDVFVGQIGGDGNFAQVMNQGTGVKTFLNILSLLPRIQEGYS